jgi:DNA-binding transcriptional LysR family regulator
LFPIILASRFVPTGSMPKFFQPLFLASPHIVIDDFGILAQVAATTDAVWLSSAFAAHQQLRDGLLEELTLPDGSRLGWFRVMMYSLARHSLSPAALLLRDQIAEELRRLTKLGTN